MTNKEIINKIEFYKRHIVDLEEKLEVKCGCNKSNIISRIAAHKDKINKLQNLINASSL